MQRVYSPRKEANLQRKVEGKEKFEIFESIQKRKDIF